MEVEKNQILENIPPIIYKYRAVSLSHFKELKNNIQIAKEDKNFSQNEVFQSYIEAKDFNFPEEFPDAKFIVIVAIYKKLAQLFINYEGKRYKIYVGSPYYDNGITLDMIQDKIKSEIIPSTDYYFIHKNNVHSKLLAVRSGLGKYGRNNLCYVDEMGCFLDLRVFYTNYEFPQDDWGEIEMMPFCEHCKICQLECPTGAITGESFLLKVDNCIPLYNEIDGIFPGWIPSSAHNALIGCVKCQIKCPGNKLSIKDIHTLGELTEEETKMIIQNNIPNEHLEIICNKLRLFTYDSVEFMLPRFARNLKAFLQN